MTGDGDGGCACRRDRHDPRLVVVTGGPGAGKTAVLELARRSLCEHVVVLPEAAGIVFGGGFPRHPSDPGRRAAQRAIFHVQRQVELLHLGEARAAVLLCDRGTLDGLAYWPSGAGALLDDVGTSRDAELARYHAVVHLRTPGVVTGYDRSNPLRIEDAGQAHAIDERILHAWQDHPDRTIIDAAASFRDKADQALAAISRQLPKCCQPLATTA